MPFTNGMARPAARKVSYLIERAEKRDFPASLNGRFQGLLVDRPSGTALLFNDRYGLHRLYYHEAADAFLLCGGSQGDPGRLSGPAHD